MSYYTKITTAGLAAITAAMNNNSKVPITYMAFGDGNGYVPDPDENATSLVNEVYRVGVNKVEVHSKNPNWLVCEAIIPSAVGGFNIREVALYDSTGNTMLAIASYPPTYKPTVEEGAAKIQTIRIVIQVDNSGNFQLIVDPDVVLATAQYVDDKIKEQYLSSIDALRSHKTTHPNELVFIKAYSEGGDPRGGGKFYHVPNSTAADDGIFCIVTNDGERYFKCLSNNTISIYEAGLTGNSTIDEGGLLNNLFDKAAQYSTKYNFTWKTKVSGLNTRVLSTAQLNFNLTLLELEDIYIISNIPTQATYNKTTGVALIFFGQDAWTTNPESWRRRGIPRVNNVYLEQKDKNIANIIGVYFDTTVEGHFAKSIFESLCVNGFDYNFCFTSNNYLMTFRNCGLQNSKKHALVTSNLVGITGELTNAGENIRFFGGEIANAKAVLNLSHQMWLSFHAVSFDYMGKSTDTEGWFQLRGDVHLNFLGCHFEAGNENTQLGKKMFEVFDSKASVSIYGGAMIFGNNNDNEYVFYSHQKSNHNFSIENTYVWGSGLAKRSWSNTGMGKFKVFGNKAPLMNDVMLKAYQAINKTSNKDPLFIKSNLFQSPVDKWIVSSGGDIERNNPISSSGINGVFTTTEDENGSTVPCLKFSVLKPEQSIRLLIPKTKQGNFNPTLRLKIKTSVAKSNMWASFYPVDVMNFQDKFPIIDTTRWDKSIFGFNNQIVTEGNTIKVIEPTVFSYTQPFDGIESFDHYMFNLNFTTNTGFDLYILSAEVYEMDV